MGFQGNQTTIRQYWVGRLPLLRPAQLSETEWLVLWRHVLERASYRALARELGVTPGRVREVAMTASARLRVAPPATGQELASLDLPPTIVHELLRAGYDNRAALTTATDAELQQVRGLGPRRLAQLRAALRANASLTEG